LTPIEQLVAIAAELSSLPPPPFLASSNLLPKGRATLFRHEGREFIGAHPTFWAMIPQRSDGLQSPIGDVPIYDLDTSAERHREFYAAMSAVLGKAL
jgi:hypothetical protein